MHEFTGKWITDEEFYCLKPRDIFHRHFNKVDLPCDEHRNCHILFRKKFILDNKPENATIYITADDYYKLYINGRFAGQGPAPAYHFEYNYNVIDISEYLCEGENTIAVHTLYHGLINRPWQSGDNRHGLLLDLCVDGNPSVCSDTSFKTCRHTAYTESGIAPLRYHNTQFLETYDSNAREVGFEKPEFDDSYWADALINECSDHNLKEQKTKMLVFEKIMPVEKTVQPDKIIYDFGANVVGYFTAVAKGKKGDVVTVRCGQELNDDGSVRYQLRAGCHYTEDWILSDGESKLEWYDYKPFRYVEILCNEGISFEDEFINARHYPFTLNCEMKPEYQSSEELTAIWNLCVHTLKYGVQEVIQDCMDREKGFYLGDGCYSALAQLILTKDDSIARKLINDAFSTSVVDGGLLSCMDGSNMLEIAEYPLILISFVLWHYRLTGDKEYLKENFAKSIGVLEYYREKYEKDYVIGNIDKWCVVEWPPNFRDGYDVDISDNQICEQPHVSLNAYYVHAVRTVNKMAEILGESAYRDEKPLMDAFFKTFYDEEKHLFKDGRDTDHISIVGNSFPFGFGLIPDEYFKDNFIKMLKERKFSSLSFFTAYPVLTGLCSMGEDELVRECLSDEGAWLRMLKEGATTIFEGWGKESKSNASLFHLTYTYAATFLANVDHKNLFSL